MRHVDVILGRDGGRKEIESDVEMTMHFSACGGGDDDDGVMRACVCASGSLSDWVCYLGGV